jgi:DNA-binding Xre family transcriptional regulator
VREMNNHVGGSFDDFLKEEGLYEESKEEAIKRVIALQIQQAMKERNLTKTEMAKSIGTSRAALDRLLNPDTDAVTLHSLKKAAGFLGKELILELR